jgi:hypothetical protein
MGLPTSQLSRRRRDFLLPNYPREPGTCYFPIILENQGLPIPKSQLFQRTWDFLLLTIPEKQGLSTSQLYRRGEDYLLPNYPREAGTFYFPNPNYSREPWTSYFSTIPEKQRLLSSQLSHRTRAKEQGTSCFPHAPEKLFTSFPPALEKSPPPREVFYLP